MNQPNYEKAAIMAVETLIKYGISTAPIDPLPILKKIPGVLVISYETMSNSIGIERKCAVSMFGDESHDACTSVSIKDGKLHYIITYNQKLPTYIVQRALARELAHIVLGHDGSLPDEVRFEEAKCFAMHLMCPRPLIHSLQATGLRITVDMIGSLSGCYDYCLSCMRKLPAVNVPPELNAMSRDLFMPYILNFFEYERIAEQRDGSALADFGSYMDGYVE